MRDAREHGVLVHEADVNASDWDCTLELPSPRERGEGQGEGQMLALRSVAAPHPMAEAWLRHDPLPVSTGRGRERAAVRLGLRLIAGLPEAEAQVLMEKRGAGYTSVSALWGRSGMRFVSLELLANADAFRSIGRDRRRALWEVRGLAGGASEARPRRTAASAAMLIPSENRDLFAEPKVDLPAMALSEHVAEDYAATGLSLKAHPVAFFRNDLKGRGVITSAEHWDERRKGRRVSIAGLVLVRQRPGTAKGVIFLTLEDETGIVNVVVWPKVFDANRRVLMTAQFLLVKGRIEREGLVIHVVAEELVDLTHRLRELSDGAVDVPATARDVREGSWKSKSRDFH